jgi:hypothetical protein
VKNLPVFLIVGLFFLPTAAKAQLAVYGDASVLHLSQPATSTTTSSSAWFGGPGVGIYDDFAHFGPLAAGLDLRANYLFASDQRYRNALLGIRVSAHPPFLPLRPYVQGSIGVGGARPNSNDSLATHFNNKFEYQVAGGLDLGIFPHLDYRVAELSYGRVSTASSAQTSTQSNLVTVTTGIVLRLF